MSRLVIATNNKDKVREIKAILGCFYDEILSLKEAGISLDVVEDGQTFMQNAVKKATEAAVITKCDTLADDSGLCVDALSGAPGIYSARYAGENVTYEDNNKKLLKQMERVEERGAKFVCAIALVLNGEVITVSGEICGSIAKAEHGGGFGYDPLFFVPELGQTFGQLSPEVKNKISHRGKALRAIQSKALQRR